MLVADAIHHRFDRGVEQLDREHGGDVVQLAINLQKVIDMLSPDVKIVAVEPKNSAALLGREPGLHQIQGIGDGFIPDVLDLELVDMVNIMVYCMDFKVI